MASINKKLASIPSKPRQLIFGLQKKMLTAAALGWKSVGQWVLVSDVLLTTC